VIPGVGSQVGGAITALKTIRELVHWFVQNLVEIGQAT